MAQTVSTTPRHHFYQANGELAAGGTLEIFDANTITHAVTWFDRDGAVAHQNANPLTLDSQGAAVVWLESGKVYDWIAKDALGNTIDNAQGIMGSTSAISLFSQWVNTALLPTFVNTRTFTLIGDQTSLYSVGRRARVTLTGGFKYATILSSVFSTLTTITLGFSSAADVLDATLSAVDIGLEVAASPSLQVGVGSVIDLTGYAGADVPLQVGQSAIYDIAAVTTLLLRIAVATNQFYNLVILPNFPAGAAGGAGVQLLPNNSVGVPNNIIYMPNYNNNGTWFSPAGVGQNLFTLHTDFTFTRIDADISTRTENKSVFTRFTAFNGTQYRAGFVHNISNDIATAWGISLGTLTFPTATTGRVMLRRVM